MDTENFCKIVKNDLHQIKFNVVDLTSDKVRIRGNAAVADCFDDEILIEILGYKSGTVHIFLTFDRIIKSEKTLNLINDLNQATSWIKAYIIEINNCTYLQAHYSYHTEKNEEQAADCVMFALNDLLNEEVLKYLKPLTELTE